MKLLTYICLASLFIIPSGCRVSYSFTGASISPSIKTINISYFPNNALLVIPTLSQTFTDALKDRFSSQTDLDLVNSGGDLLMEGSITGYSITPQAIQGNETAGLNRLMISVSVKFTNTQDDSQSFESTFSRFSDFPSNQDITAVQDQLISDVTQQLVEDIFNKAVVNW